MRVSEWEERTATHQLLPLHAHNNQWEIPIIKCFLRAHVELRLLKNKHTISIQQVYKYIARTFVCMCVCTTHTLAWVEIATAK